MTYYDEIAKGYSELHGEEQLKKARIMVEKLKPRKDDKLLDVGCGDGACLELFHCESVGIDPSKELISRYKGPHKLFVGTAEELPFKDKQFDIVISITAIQNFSDIEKGLKEIARVGKDKFAISVLKKSPKAEWIEYLVGKQFLILETVDEEKDLIFFATKKH